MKTRTPYLAVLFLAGPILAGCSSDANVSTPSGSTGGSGGGSTASGDDAGAGGTTGDSGGRGGTPNDGAAAPMVVDGATDAAAGDAVADVGATDAEDAGKPEPGCTTTGKSLLLCDDFETVAAGGLPDKAVWKIETATNATVTIDSQHVKRGKQALHLHTLAKDDKALLHETKTFPLPGKTDSFYGRAFLFLDKNSNLPSSHSTLFEATGKAQQNVQNALTAYRYGIVNQIFLANCGGSVEFYGWNPDKETKPAFPQGEWMCMEWGFLGDTNELKFWLNGNEIKEVDVPSAGTGMGPWSAPTFDTFTFGWVTYAGDNASPEYDVWYDGIALDTQRIGCDK